jgi:hypothetical protein
VLGSYSGCPHTIDKAGLVVKNRHFCE